MFIAKKDQLEKSKKESEKTMKKSPPTKSG
jgi:hypothetical protein